ncbi:ABC transporter ATP-binding protein [Pseudobutyrivibrio ruminis]|uniref:ATP-binding cassette, subfamily B n=1 Tax=Pseudobutyrivibrio ruminis DSM 9787 TaxID=1123011 RepID=A0A285SP83_9FIRM|nr:ABC transporter ATP-binding protein [Pseudobutyrivibrio ruminis]SOC10032.1 ATP-binding cassette, subfamily B [Pseudobutyrivibrio ruminis DSM 9787]
MVKRLLQEIKEYTAAALVTPIFMILEVAMEMIIPLLVADLVDKGVEAGNMSEIYRIGGYMLICAVVGLFGGVMGAVYGSKASAGLAKNLRKKMFENIQTFSFENIDKFSTAGLVTRLTTDVTNVQNAFIMVLRMGFRAPVTVIVAMVLSFRINVHIASNFFFAMVIILAFMTFVLFKTRPLFEILMKKYDDLNASVQENVTGIRVVKAYVREAFEKTKFVKGSQGIYKAATAAEKMIAFTMPMMSAVIYVCIILISWFGAHEIVIEGTLTTGELVSLFSYCMNILMSLMFFAMIFIMVTMSVASMKRIYEVLEEKTTITNGENPIYEVPDGSIQFKDVVFGYNKTAERPVLDHINLQINSGETIGVLGGTGSAKTTLVSMISRLYDVDEGEVLVGGNNVKDYDVETIRNQVAVVLQNNVLFSGTIAENLRWGDKNATDEEVKRAAKLACADEFIEKFPDGYNTHIEQGGTNVSGGQRQRLCIARALLKKPKILILDDSTSAVDTATDASIRRAFREEIPGTTKLIIAQRISSVMDADRIIVMDDGKVNDFGTHEELMARNEIYKEIYEQQTGAGSGDFDKAQEGGED